MVQRAMPSATQTVSLPNAAGSGRSTAGSERSKTLIVMIGAACFGAAAWAFSAIAPQPYMDEVFHVPQTQAYCQGDYGRWNPKITTPPGLYLLAVAYSRLISSSNATLVVLGLVATQSSGAKERCAAGMLRQVNWIFSLGTLVVMRALLSRRMAPGKALAHALLLWLYPVSFFFSFLFYTDPGATFFALLCYFLATGRPRGGGWGRRFGSSLAGGVSVLFRQTNAIWVAFTLAVCLLEDFTPVVLAPSAWRSDDAPLVPPSGASEQVSPPPAAEMAVARRGGKGTPPSSRRPTSSTTRKRKNSPGTLVSSGLAEPDVAEARPGRSLTGTRTGNDGNDDEASAAQWDHDSLSPLRLLLLLARAALSDVGRGAPLLRARAPLAAPILLFAVFVWGFNGGTIVLGDKENHSPGGPPHLAQLAYLVAVAASLWGVVGGREAAFGWEARSGFARWARERGVAGVAVIVAGVAVAMWRYSLDHPFLLSDNRHYPFYVWQRLLSRVYVRVGLAPAYVYCGWLVASRLRRRKPALWVLTYAGAAAVVLVPSPLVEPRYLTIPVLLAHLESAERSWESLLAGVVACAAVNAVTVYVFLERPFAWHDGSLARFMW